jgi:hypothetical protein
MAEYIWIDSTGGVRSKSKASGIIFTPTEIAWRRIVRSVMFKVPTGPASVDGRIGTQQFAQLQGTT